MKIIGISGVARSGKDLCAKLIIKHLESKGLSARTFAFAYELKSECAPFIREKLNLDVFSDNTAEKNLFRDMLVWYGKTMRKKSGGKHWINLLQKAIDQSYGFDYGIITDIRFDEYPEDEIDWVQKTLKGPVIHLKKFTYGFPTDGRQTIVKGKALSHKIYTEAANQEELLNDPKLQKKADYLLEWEDINYSSPQSYAELLNNEYLNNTVISCLTTLNPKFTLFN